MPDFFGGSDIVKEKEKGSVLVIIGFDVNIKRKGEKDKMN